MGGGRACRRGCCRDASAGRASASARACANSPVSSSARMRCPFGPGWMLHSEAREGRGVLSAGLQLGACNPLCRAQLSAVRHGARDLQARAALLQRHHDRCGHKAVLLRVLCPHVQVQVVSAPAGLGCWDGLPCGGIPVALQDGAVHLRGTVATRAQHGSVQAGVQPAAEEAAGGVGGHCSRAGSLP